MFSPCGLETTLCIGCLVKSGALLGQAPSLPIDKFTDDYIGGLIRQVATRLRSTDPRDKKPSTGSGYPDWDYALVQIRRLELDAIRKHLWKVTKK